MSIVFSNTSGKSGIIEGIERTLFGDDGFGKISGNTTRLAAFTAAINLAMDNVLSIIFNSDGTWQFDDGNQTDYPIITANLVASQRDYSFTTDGSGNLILDIYKVLVADASGRFREILPVDVQSEQDTAGFTDGQNLTGTPTRYDKTANGFFLDPIPSYSLANGLKVYINRESTYFTVADTTKKPGFAGIFHEYLILRPSYVYARDNGLASADRLKVDMLIMEQAIAGYYADRNRDERKRLSITQENNR